MCKLKWLTMFIVVFAPAVIIIYDWIVNLTVGYDATITSVLRHAAERYPELPWITAGLMLTLWLHLFFSIVVKR